MTIARPRRLSAAAEAILCTALLAIAPPDAMAQPPECTTATLNRSCVVFIDRESPVSPLPIRVASQAGVAVRVPRRPLEKIVFDFTLADVVAPDPTGAIFSAFVTPLKSFVASVEITTPPAGGRGGPPPPAPPPPVAFSAADRVAAAIEGIAKSQDATQQTLVEAQATVKKAGLSMRAFQQTKAGTWQPADFSKFRAAFICQVLGAARATDTGVSCEPAAEASAAARPLPSLQALEERIKAVIEDFTRLSEEQKALLAGRLDSIVVRQGQLRATAASVGTAQAALVDAARLVEQIDPVGISTGSELLLGGFPARTNRVATIKIAAQDLVTKAASPIANVTVTWGGTRWEASGGALFSTLPSRTFQNAPIIVNGQPSLDAGGKINTRVTESITRPTVVPAALAHYRFVEGVPDHLQQRLAFLWTFALGVNPYSGSADFATGPTLSYRGLMMSPVWHWGRDLRLTNGLAVNQELGSSPPALSTERFWKGTFALGVSYRIPIN